MAHEFKIKNALQILNTQPVTGITDSSIFTNDSSSLATVNAIKNYVELAAGSGSLSGLSDVTLTDPSLYDIITPNASGDWINQQKEWYVDSSLIQPVNSDYNVQLTAIEIEEDAGTVTLIDMSVSSTPSAGTEESYAFNMDGNAVLKIYGEADGAGGLDESAVVVEADYQYMGTPNTNGSWRFYISQDASADMVFEKRVSGTWTEGGRFVV